MSRQRAENPPLPEGEARTQARAFASDAINKAFDKDDGHLFDLVLMDSDSPNSNLFISHIQNIIQDYCLILWTKDDARKHNRGAKRKERLKSVHAAAIELTNAVGRLSHFDWGFLREHGFDVTVLEQQMAKTIHLDDAPLDELVNQLRRLKEHGLLRVDPPPYLDNLLDALVSASQKAASNDAPLDELLTKFQRLKACGRFWVDPHPYLDNLLDTLVSASQKAASDPTLDDMGGRVKQEAKDFLLFSLSAEFLRTLAYSIMNDPDIIETEQNDDPISQVRKICRAFETNVTASRVRFIVAIMKAADAGIDNETAKNYLTKWDKKYPPIWYLHRELAIAFPDLSKDQIAEITTE